MEPLQRPSLFFDPPPGIGDDLEAPEPERRVFDILPGREPVGEGESTIELDEEKRRRIATDLCERLQLYDEAMADRIRRWDEIEDAYDMAAEPGQGTETPEAEAVTSEMLMSQVDQAAARMQAAIAGADPLVRIRPKAAKGAELRQWAEEAESAERVVNNYVLGETELKQLLPIACHRTAKLGTAVLTANYELSGHKAYYYDEETGAKREEDVSLGGIEYELVENRDVVFWPPRLYDWQKAEMMGHRAVYTNRSAWRRKARALGVDDELLKKVESSAGGGDKEKSLESEFEPVEVTILYLHDTLPGDDEPSRFIVWLHEASESLLRIEENRNPEQRHPYFPVRWKMTDRSGWGDGVGDEVLMTHVAATALDNLELENIAAGAVHAVRVDPHSLPDIALDRIRPGEKIRAEAGEIEPMKLGGEAPEIYRAQENKKLGARLATGLAWVMGGMGDPIQKSGTGTGATMALIEQASVKFNVIGNQVKMDLAPLFEYSLELINLYVPEGVLYSAVSEEDAGVIEMLRYIPPRRRIARTLHIEVQAPSAATSQEARKIAYLTMFNFLVELMKMLGETVGPALQQENPEMLARWQREWAELMISLAREVVRHHDLPGLSEDLPELPTPTAEEVRIAELQQQVQQLQGQLQQILMQAQQMLGPAQPQPQQGGPQQMPLPMGG